MCSRTVFMLCHIKKDISIQGKFNFFNEVLTLKSIFHWCPDQIGEFKQIDYNMHLNYFDEETLKQLDEDSESTPIVVYLGEQLGFVVEYKKRLFYLKKVEVDDDENIQESIILKHPFINKTLSTLLHYVHKTAKQRDILRKFVQNDKN